MLWSHRKAKLVRSESRSSQLLVTSLATIVTLLVGLDVAGQQKPGTLPPPNPQAPSVEAIFPPGGQRGGSVDVSVRGRELTDALSVMATFPVHASIVADEKEPAARCTLKLTIPKDAPLGVHGLRIATRRGISNMVPFCVDDLPEVVASGNNRSVAEAQKIPVPCVISGRVDAEASYYFRLQMQAGQRVCFEIIGRRMGSPLDSLLIVQDASGRQLAFSDDAPGLQRDARLVFTAKENGEYVVQLRDVRYQGGANYTYRLRVGDFPCATTTFPLAVKPGGQATIHFAGPYVDGVQPVPIEAPAEASTLALLVTPQRPNAPPGWPVAVGLSNLEEVLEREPNDSPEQAQRLTLPIAINGRFDRPADRDFYRLSVKKGQRLVVEAQTWEWGSPSSAYLVLRDATGKQQLATSNPMQDPPRIEYSVPADGEVILSVEHLHFAGGPEETYRVTVNLATPVFRVEALQDRVDVPPGGVGICFVRVLRSGYTGPIHIRVMEPKQLRGEALLTGEQALGVLSVSAESGLQTGAYPLRLLASAKTEAGEITVPVTMNEVLSAAFNNVAYPPRHLLTALAVAITEPPPFLLEVKYATDRLARGQTGLEALVRLQRQQGFEDEVQVIAVAPPPAQGQPVALATAASVKIARGQTEAKLVLKLPNNLPTGQLPIAVVGQAKHAGRSYQVYARGSTPEVVAGK